MRNKAQMQMTETIFVVFFILIIIVLGFVVFSKFQEEAIKKQQKEYRSSRVIEMAHRLSSWPELECSVAGTTQYVCLDKVKLGILGDFINDSKRQSTYAFNYYFELLRDSKITIIEIYPSHSKTFGKDYWVLYENTGSGQTTEVIWIPVNLYDQVTQTRSLAIMELLIYE